jgi:membrane protein involved in colicin uptake
MASAKRTSNEATPPPDSADRREFLKEQERMRREQEAAAAERRRRAASREAASSDAKLEQAAKDKEQAMKDKQSKDAYERVKPQPFRKGGMPDLTGDGKVTRADVLKGRGVFKHGGKVKKYASGGSVSSASKRADGCITKGKTRGKFV